MRFPALAGMAGDGVHEGQISRKMRRFLLLLSNLPLRQFRRLRLFHCGFREVLMKSIRRRIKKPVLQEECKHRLFVQVTPERLELSTR